MKKLKKTPNRRTTKTRSSFLPNVFTKYRKYRNYMRYVLPDLL